VEATGDGAHSGRHSSMYIVPEPCDSYTSLLL
jgi:hypothetical protein